jgi:phosphoadenosine phosphosulfate reductase
VLSGYTAWVTGVRREEAPTRANTPVVEYDAKRNMVKLNPIAPWTQDDLDGYITDNGVLVNPLQYDGYPSIGCQPCTKRVAPGEDPRSGRWAGLAKTECGLHV